MHLRCAATGVFVIVLSAATAPARVEANSSATSDESARIAAIAGMLHEMAPESRAAAAQIRTAYRRELRNALSTRDALIASLESGHLARLPLDPSRFNLDVRLAGAHPIAERDLLYQPLYVAARPATLGALLTIAGRVRPGPLEVTSLVRHRAYQRALRRTNPNADTIVPTHTLGLAFDISLLHTPLDTALEIRDVLRAMSDAGEVFVIAETQQLVFHVVPTPRSLASFDAFYHSLMLLVPDALQQPVVLAAADVN